MNGRCEERPDHLLHAKSSSLDTALRYEDRKNEIMLQNFAGQPISARHPDGERGDAHMRFNFSYPPKEVAQELKAGF